MAGVSGWVLCHWNLKRKIDLSKRQVVLILDP